MFLVPPLPPSRLAKGGRLKPDDLFPLPVQIIEASYSRSKPVVFIRAIRRSSPALRLPTKSQEHAFSYPTGGCGNHLRAGSFRRVLAADTNPSVSTWYGAQI